MIVGIDPGERRVGVAVADLETRFARPLEVIDRQATDAVERITAIVQELEAEAHRGGPADRALGSIGAGGGGATAVC